MGSNVIGVPAIYAAFEVGAARYRTPNRCRLGRLNPAPVSGTTVRIMRIIGRANQNPSYRPPSFCLYARCLLPIANTDLFRLNVVYLSRQEHAEGRRSLP